MRLRELPLPDSAGEGRDSRWQALLLGDVRI
jgi:hypothetical protein